MTTYKRIASVSKTVEVLRFLADQKLPVPGAEVARAVSLPTGTVMCHLVTLEDARLVRRIGEHWELSDGMAIFWARKKAQLETDMVNIKKQLHNIGVEYE